MSAAEAPLFLVVQPSTTDLLVVDERLPLIPLFQTLAAGGYTVINDRHGRLVITRQPEDWRAEGTLRRRQAE